MDVVPNPSDSGSDGSQVKNEHSVDLVEANQLAALPIATTIQGIAASNTKAFGGEITSALLVGSFNQLANELQICKKDNSQLRKRMEHLGDEISNQKIANAQLTERISSLMQSRTLKNTSITFGTFLVTTSITFFSSPTISQSYGFAFLAVGVIMVVTGWYAPKHGGDE